MKDNTMKTKNRIFVAACVLVLLCGMNAYADDPGDSVATCAITLTVDSIIEWEGAAFPAINLATITAHADSPEGQSNYTLWTNCNVTIAADNTNASRLTDGTDTIRTEYQLSTDGDGVTETGATAGAIDNSDSDQWTIHSLFLDTPLLITHVNTDGGVEVTLYVKAVQEDNEVPDSGDYAATQTLTAAWESDN
jgi:hypothetical protein